MRAHDDGVSRRDFFFGAGATAGALATLGSVAGATLSAPAQAALKKQYYSYYVGLELDGSYAGLAISAEGGEPVLTLPPPHSGLAPTVRYEPLAIRLHDVSRAMYEWIGKSVDGAGTAKPLSVITANQDLAETYRLVTQGARLTEILLDKLDASQKDVARFEVKVAPASSAHVFGGKGTMKASTMKASPLLQSNFRLYVQGLETIASRIRSVTQAGVRAREDGVLVPVPIKFEVSLADAGLIYAWMNDALSGKANARAAELQLLSKDLARVAASISLSNVAITRVSYPAQSAEEALQLVEVECTPQAVKFNLGDLVT